MERFFSYANFCLTMFIFFLIMAVSGCAPMQVRCAVIYFEDPRQASMTEGSANRVSDEVMIAAVEGVCREFAFVNTGFDPIVGCRGLTLYVKGHRNSSSQYAELEGAVQKSQMYFDRGRRFAVIDFGIYGEKAYQRAFSERLLEALRSCGMADARRVTEIRPRTMLN